MSSLILEWNTGLMQGVLHPAVTIVNFTVELRAEILVELRGQ